MNRLKAGLNKLIKVAGETAIFKCGDTEIEVGILRNSGYQEFGIEDNSFLTADDSWIDTFKSDKANSRFIIDSKSYKIFDVVVTKAEIRVKIDDGS